MVVVIAASLQQQTYLQVHWDHPQELSDTIAYLSQGSSGRSNHYEPLARRRQQHGIGE